MNDEHRDALARVIDPDSWDLYDDKRLKGKDSLRNAMVDDSREMADRIVESGLMAEFEWDRNEYLRARAKIIEGTSRTGKCYGVEDGLDGYCLHDPRCRSWPEMASGPNSDCIK